MAMVVAISSRRPLRERIVAAAIDLTIRGGWSAVTMAELADRVGVSRQTVYTEVGPKSQLAQAMVLDELGRFLALVESGFAEHPGDLEGSVRAAVHAVLDASRRSPFLRAVLAGSGGARTDLLPPLTTDSAAVLGAARATVTPLLTALCPPGDPAALEVVVDTVVRITLSHVLHPSGTPERTAQDIARLTRRLIG